MKKKIVSLTMAITILFSASTQYSASAATLAGSFSGGTSISLSRTSIWGGGYYRKTSWAQTKGYSGRHYVRAYVGGTKNDPTNAWADSGRIWSNGNVTASATTGELYVDANTIPKAAFPTGYAKYGK